MPRVVRSPRPCCRRNRLREGAEKSLTGAVGQRHCRWMNELLVGYARVSTEQQDLTAQRNGFTRSVSVMTASMSTTG
jgi:hypothetical protein